MFKLLREKIKESATSIIPITVIVYMLSITPIFNMTNFERIVFLVCSIVLIFSMGVFNLGATLAMTPIGEYVGMGLLKAKKFWFLIIVTFVIGVLVTIAEPDLMVLANQVSKIINKTTLIICVGVGVGFFLVVAILKMLTHKSLSYILMLFYMVLFAFTAILLERGKSSLLSLAFDSGGVTTGPITVPFIMAFGVGIASTIGGRNANENSFGMVSLSSVGPIIVVLILAIFSRGSLTYTLEVNSINDYASKNIFEFLLVIKNFINSNLVEVGKALLLIFLFFLVMQISILRLPKTKIIQIVIGIFITLIGLVLFLTSVTIGFMPIGQSIGMQIAKSDKRIVILLGFIIGMTVVLAEPAVHVLNEQVEGITAGAVTKKSMMIALSIGVGISIALSFVRIIYRFSLIYYIVPGYFLSLALSLFVPPIYTAIAFDSGGVASGPMSSTFILPLVIGFCAVFVGETYVLDYAFGVIALIAMTPLITIQLLGFKAVAIKYFKNKISMKRILSAEDNQIVYFEVNY